MGELTIKLKSEICIEIIGDITQAFDLEGFIVRVLAVDQLQTFF